MSNEDALKALYEIKKDFAYKGTILVGDDFDDYCGQELIKFFCSFGVLIEKALQAKEQIDALQAENARLRALTESLEQSETKLIIERDIAQDYADKLAEKISSMTGYSIGEHSSANCPWDNALELELPQIGEK